MSLPELIYWYIPQLLLTLGIEVPIGLLLLRQQGKPFWTKAMLLVSINLISHPTAVATMLLFGNIVGYWPAFIAIELAVFWAETSLWAALFFTTRKTSALNSFITNATSAGLGILLPFIAH